MGGATRGQRSGGHLGSDFSFGFVFSVLCRTLFSSAFSLSCAPVAHWNAFGRGSPRCSSWHQNPLILTRYVRYHIALWDFCGIGQLWSLMPRVLSSTIWCEGFAS